MRPLTVTLYRADKRVLDPNTAVTTAGQFNSKHPPAGIFAEEILEAARPENKPERHKCLMLFEDDDCARGHWAKMSNGKLYTVEVQTSEILHRGDMAFVDQIGALHAADARKAADTLADRYWNEDRTDKPCIEVLVASGRLLELIGTNKQRIAEFKRRYMVRTSSTEPETYPWTVQDD